MWLLLFDFPELHYFFTWLQLVVQILHNLLAPWTYSSSPSFSNQVKHSLEKAKLHMTSQDKKFVCCGKWHYIAGGKMRGFLIDLGPDQISVTVFILQYLLPRNAWWTLDWTWLVCPQFFSQLKWDRSLHFAQCCLKSPEFSIWTTRLPHKGSCHCHIGLFTFFFN